MSFSVPILFIVFNRPETTFQVFLAIKKIKPSHLFIAADGPRAGNSSDKEKCSVVRELILKNIDWECKVETLFRDSNLGCGRAVGSALNWFFDKVEEGIVLEDDTLPSQSFFGFCESLLKKYKNNENVSYINGCNLGYKLNNGNSYGYTKIMNMWGWASWRRSIQAVDYEMKAWKELDNKKEFLEGVFANQRKQDLQKTVKFFMDVFEKTNAGLIDTWDYQHILTNFIENKVCVFPSKNLIVNIGFGQNATHTNFESVYISSLKFNSVEPPLRAPSIVSRDEKYELFFLERWGQIHYKPKIYYAVLHRWLKWKKDLNLTYLAD